MFQLDHAIAEWRREMFACGIKSSAVLDEMESHVREDMERQMRSGEVEYKAFERAVQRIGPGRGVALEFEKINTLEKNQMKRTFVILVALFGMVFGMAMILPALGQWSRTGVLHMYPLLMGMVLVVAGGLVSFYGIWTQKAAQGRRLISLAVTGAGIFYAIPFVMAFFEKTDLAGWLFCALLAATSVAFFGSCFYLNKRIPAR